MSIKIYLKKHQFYREFYEFHWSDASSLEHTHCDCYEIVIALKPYIKNVVDGELSVLKERSACIIAPRFTHNVLYTDTPYCKKPFLFNLAIDEHVFCNLCNNVSSNMINKLNYNKASEILFTEEEFNYIYYLINKLSKTVDEHTSSTLVKKIVTNILYLLNLVDNIEINSKLEEYAYSVKEQIDNLDYLTVDIKDIYAKYPVSFSSLINEFKRITGKTIINYIVDKRMSYAKLLLLTTNYSITYISQTVGYSSQSFFISKFKETFGKTPLQYKKENKIMP